MIIYKIGDMIYNKYKIKCKIIIHLMLFLAIDNALSLTGGQLSVCPLDAYRMTTSKP